MKRIAIVGSGGAGKSTLARRLGEVLGIEVYHLDAHYWRAGWVETPDDEWDKCVGELVSRESWIIDGNYGRTMEPRLRAADTVIFLDLPRYICLWRVLKRRIQYAGRQRPDMGPGCPEKIDLEFLKWLWDFPRHTRPRVIGCIEEHGRHCEVVVLRSPRQVAEYLHELESEIER